jgi:membrane fusion protein, multidrug efflux system
MRLKLRSVAVGAAVLLALSGAGCADGGGAPAKPSGEAGGRSSQADPAGRREGGRAGRPSGPVAVLVTTVSSQPFARVLEAVGSARANEAVDLTAKNSNRITAIRFREGQQVRTGEVLVEFDSDQARATLAEAEAALQDAQRQYKRSHELFTTRALSEAQLDQINAKLSANEARVAGARSQLNDTIIRAPFGGRVGLRNVSIGAFVNPGTVITTLDDTSIIKVDFSVPEVFLASIAEGLQIKARTSAYPEAEFIGKVLSIDSRLDPVSRAITVRAQIDNRDRRLRPGMLMTVNMARPEPPALLVPEQALVPEGSRKFVFAVRNGKAAKVEVETGRRRPGAVEVIAGLVAGDVVIVEGTQKVRDGAEVKVQVMPVDEASA